MKEIREMKELVSSVLSLCQELVRAPSLSGDERRAAEIAARAMRDFGYDEIVSDKYGSVIGIRRGARPGKTILLDAHLDVVAATNREQWRHDPFGGEIADGKIWGRGACDDKGALAAMICAMAGVPRDQFAGKIVVSASVCEENLTGAAFAHILDQHPADLVIVGEPTQLKLGVAQKGRAGIVVDARGKSAHTSRPELGENAVYKMMDAIARLRALDLPGDPQLGRGVLELTEIVSEPLPGAGFVPSGCRARFVERTMPDETQTRVLERLQNALAGLVNVSARFDALTQICYTGNLLAMPDFIAGWRAHLQDDWLPKIISGLRAAELPAETFAMPAGTNASASAGARGIASFILGPGSIAQAHTVDEWIAVDALLAGERAYREVVCSCLGG
jgi:putative selenium metabolism hydrolase